MLMRSSRQLRRLAFTVWSGIRGAPSLSDTVKLSSSVRESGSVMVSLRSKE